MGYHAPHYHMTTSQPEIELHFTDIFRNKKDIKRMKNKVSREVPFNLFSLVPQVNSLS